MMINVFFTVVALILASIYLFFQPVHLQDQSDREIARLDLRHFTLYEMNASGVSRMLVGERGRGYSDRYEIETISLQDKKGDFERQMHAAFGRSTQESIELVGDVVVERNDGSQIHADALTYHKDKETVYSDEQFFIEYQEHRVRGTELYYDMQHGRIQAKHITAHFQFPEEGAP